MNISFRFSKMHGLGNDFIVINAYKQTFDPQKIAIAELADRHLGIGFDQMLIIEPSHQADFFCRIFNADGSEAEQCGNGLRCIARYLDHHQLLPNKKFSIETKAGLFPIEIKNHDEITVTFKPPTVQRPIIDLTLSHPIKKINISILSLGNPHVIVFLDTIDTTLPNELAPLIASHPLFPESVNIGFMQIMNRNTIRLRTFERGVGETLACGSNATAAVFAGLINNFLDEKTNVQFQRGQLTIEWNSNSQTISMTGPAAHVFDGEIK